MFRWRIHYDCYCLKVLRKRSIRTILFPLCALHLQLIEHPMPMHQYIHATGMRWNYINETLCIRKPSRNVPKFHTSESSGIWKCQTRRRYVSYSVCVLVRSLRVRITQTHLHVCHFSLKMRIITFHMYEFFGQVCAVIEMPVCACVSPSSVRVRHRI